MIREATAADSPDVVRVIKAVYDEFGFDWHPDDYHADLYDLATHYLEPGLPFWVAEVDGVVVGTAALGLFPTIPGAIGELVEHEGVLRAGGTQCSLERLYLLREARGTGLGADLMRTTLQAAKQRGCAAMEIWSDKEFEAAHRLYAKFGARTIGDRLCHDPNQSPEWGLVLPIA